MREGVAFFVARHDGVAAGCGGVQLFGLPPFAAYRDDSLSRFYPFVIA